MHIKIIICTMLMVSLVSAARAQSDGEQNARKLVTELYSYSLASFEFAEFDKRLNLRTHCELLKQFFSEDLVKQPTQNSGCILSHLVSVRYPALRLEDVNQMRGTTRPPKADISNTQINADEVTVDVITQRAKSVYFLKRVEQDWRIVNALLFENWPVVGGPCRSSFLAAPTKDQKKLELEKCRMLKAGS